MAECASDWFVSEQVSSNLYWIREQFVCENQCNIWLIKGGSRDVVIDCGFGVCDLRRYLQSSGLIDETRRQCLVILTHVHFDHSGGAKHFEEVYIHEADALALQRGSQVHTLNYVKPSHFIKKPYPHFSACQYHVQPTRCSTLVDGEKISLGDDEDDYLEVIHTPGHTPGSVLLHYPRYQWLFSGDFVYDCGNGSALFDWLPDSCTTDYLRSVERVVRWCEGVRVKQVFPGHMQAISQDRMLQLIHEYAQSRAGCMCKGCVRCMNGATYVYFLLGCFRCCPC